MVGSTNNVDFGSSSVTIGSASADVVPTVRFDTIYVRVPTGADPDSFEPDMTVIRYLPAATPVQLTFGVLSSATASDQTALLDIDSVVNNAAKAQDGRIVGPGGLQLTAAGPEPSAPWMIVGYGAPGYRPRRTLVGGGFGWTRVGLSFVYIHGDAGDIASNTNMTAKPAAVFYDTVSSLYEDTGSSDITQLAAARWRWAELL